MLVILMSEERGADLMGSFLPSLDSWFLCGGENIVLINKDSTVKLTCVISQSLVTDRSHCRPDIWSLKKILEH